VTDAEFIEWLRSPSRRLVMLAEVGVRVGGVETTRYLSSRGYVTGAAETPASTAYRALITGGGKVTERLPLDGSPGMSFTDIELDNTNGDLDDWLDDVWTNRAANVYVGDSSWLRADFRLVFSGVVAALVPSERRVLNIVMRDKMERLNTPMTDTKLGGSTQNADRILPLTFGEVHNIEALLVDPALLKYKWHNGAAERLIEVRDNGAPVSATATLSDGTFVLNQQSFGTVTASVQGAKPGGAYTNRIAPLIEHIVKTYGTDPFVSGDIDSANFTAFDAAHTQAVGLYVPDRELVLSVCQMLAASVGAQVCMNAVGQLQLLKIALPAVGTPTTADHTNMHMKSLVPVARPDVRAAAKINYCKNYTIQTSLQTGLPDDHKDLFSRDWLTVTSADATVKSVYKLTGEPEGEDTCLLVGSEATTEAQRRRDLWKTQRTVYRYTGHAEKLLEALGAAHTITHPRFNLSGGVTGQIVGVERDWLAATAVIEVLT
jgi:hypothetical protein